MNAFLPYIPIDRRRALATGTLLPDRTQGTALFVDISGFSRLTEQLVHAHGRRRGAEELTRHLNAVYTPLIAAVHAQGGSVIGFSGDAITCWFDARANDSRFSNTQSDNAMRDAANRAAGAAGAIQAAMPQFATITINGTGGDAVVSLAVKTAIASGPARRFLVGDPDVQVIDVLAGSTVDRMAQAEQLAHQGETLIDEATTTLLGENVDPLQWRTAANSRFALLKNPPTHQKSTINNSPLTINHSLSQTWLLPALRPRLRHGHSAFLAELRPAVALFLRFDGIDYDGDEQAGDQLDRYIRWVQSILTRYDGALIQLTTGDKGSYLYATFGAPIAHDDDAGRAAAAALALRTPSSDLAIASSQIGLAQGRMRVGAYGSEMRRTYGVLGDATNLAARLMTQAASGQVLLSPAVTSEISASHRTEAAGDVTLKSGATLPVHRLLSVRAEAARALVLLHEEPLVGREDEVARVEALLAQVRETGRGAILRVEGEAGVGKSHLTAEIAARARQRDFDVSIGACQSISQQSPFVPIRQITRDLLGLPVSTSSDEEDVQAQIERARQAVLRMNTDWLLRLPLLGDLLGLPIPDSETTAAFDAGLRREALTALLIEMVQTRARRAAAEASASQPLLLLIEDAHWMDEASQSIVLALARVVADAPILLALVQRPPLDENDPFYQELTTLDQQTHLALGELSAEGVAALVQQRLGGPVDPLALALVQTRAQGNAFFTEELVDALVEGDSFVRRGTPWRAPTHALSPSLVDRLRRADCLDRDGALRPDADLASVDLGLPDSVHGLVLSRLDRLPEPVKLTLKVASVIGRVFELDLLRDAHPATIERDALDGQLSTLTQRHFARLETPAPQVAYIFKHNITQEAVYQTLLYRQQRTLHGRVARALETLRPDAVDRLAHHFHSGDLARPAVRRKALHYLDAAAHHAQRDYANETALAQLDRALALETRWAWLKTKIEVLHLLGRRDEERAVLEELAGVEDVPPFELPFLWGEYYESISEFDEARDALQKALVACRIDEDCGQEARVLSRLGMIAWRQGDYAAAESVYEEALGVIGEDEAYRREEADVRYGLGLVYRQQQNYEQAQQQFQQEILLNQKRSDRQKEARTLNALGGIAFNTKQPDVALQFCNRSLEIRYAIGDLTGVGSNLLNIAQIYYSTGDYYQTEQFLKRALAIHQGVRSSWWLASTLNQFGILYTLIGDSKKAIGYLQEGQQVAQKIGSKDLEVKILCNTSIALQGLHAFKQAQNILTQGLLIANSADSEYVEAILLEEQAKVMLKLNRIGEAIESANASLAILKKLGGHNAATPNLITLAMAYHKLDKGSTALVYAREAVDMLNEDSQSDYAHQELYMCSQIFASNEENALAQLTLEAAHTVLMAKADRISDLHMRNAFLTDASDNREILEAFRRQ